MMEGFRSQPSNFFEEVKGVAKMKRLVIGVIVGISFFDEERPDLEWEGFICVNGV
jgi:hypothetical protein